MIVPIDEGEAEAQPDLPPLIVTLGPSPEDGSEWPREVLFEMRAWRGRTAEIDETLERCSAEFLSRQGYYTDGDPVRSWENTSDGKIRRFTSTIVGWRGDETPGGTS